MSDGTIDHDAAPQRDDDELAAPIDEAPPVPADDPEIGSDGTAAGELP